MSLFRADGTAFACHAESGKRTADIRLSLREVGVCAGILCRAPLRLHPSKQRLFTFQSGVRGRIRTYGCFYIGGFQDRCIRPLCHPSRSVTSESHQPIALLSRVLLGSLSFRFGIVRLLHTERLASFSRGILATFRLVCRACSPSPFVVKTVCQMAKILSIYFLSNGKLFLSTKKPPLFHRGGARC